MPDPLTALDFLMREAVALPRPSGPLPLAFLHSDLGEHVPMRSRIVAAERLTMSGAASYPVLFAAYRSGVPAASGGVWDRARAVQTLDAALQQALDDGRAAAVAAPLLAADALISARAACGWRLREEYCERAGAARSWRSVPRGAGGGGGASAPRRGAGCGAPCGAGRATPRIAALLAVAGAGAAAGGGRRATSLAAALAGLCAESPADDREARLTAMLGEGRQGQAILGALDLVQAGAAVDPPALRAALLTLRLAGQEASARTIALQTLLAGGV